MRNLRYVLCDVFTERALAGNPLAVFTDGRGLDTSTQQAIAREMNLSETVFVLPPQAGGHAKLRIFTPTLEIPFAGHPTLGSAFVLGGPLQSELVRLETGRGIIAVRLEREGARAVFGWMQQPLPTWKAFERSAALCDALGVRAPALPVEEYDNGPHHALVVVNNPAEVAGLKPDLRRLEAEFPLGVSVAAGSGTRYVTRMFAPYAGVPEDPATGSAAGPLAIHLVRHGRLRCGEPIVFDQGAAIGRPSQLHAVVRGTQDEVEAVEVGGAAVVIGRGELRL